MIDKILLDKIKRNETLTKQDLCDSHDRRLKEDLLQEQLNKNKKVFKIVI